MQQINIDIFFFIKSIKKYYKIFFIVNILVALIAIIVVMNMKVYYESQVVFYPYSPEASDPRSFFGEKIDFKVFSEDDQSEKFILMAKSKIVKTAIIEKFNLKKRYFIDTISKESDFMAHEAFADNIKIKKEENGGIIISAFDQNRDTASLIANEIVYQIEKLSQKSINDKNLSIFKVLESNYQKMGEYLNELREKNKNTTTSINVKELDFAQKEYTTLKFKLEQSQALVGNNMKSIFIIEPAYASYRKARPSRTIIIGGTIIITFLITTILIGGFEYLKQGDI